MRFDRHRTFCVKGADRSRWLLWRFRTDLEYSQMIPRLKKKKLVGAIFLPFSRLDRNDLRAYNLSYIIPRADRTYAGLWNSAHGKHMVIRRFDSSRLGFVNGTDVLRNLCDAWRVSATGGEQASAHLDALSLNSMRARVTYLYLPVWTCILGASE